MSFFSRLFGRKAEPEAQRPTPKRYASYGDQAASEGFEFGRERSKWGTAFDDDPARSSDEQALQRYRYMLRTAPPDTIEQAHAEAFAKLTPTQRAQALQDLTATLPEYERAALALPQPQDDPQTLARMATRAEMRQPGTLERVFGGSSAIGGGMTAGTILGSLAAGFVGSLIAQQFFASLAADPEFPEGDLTGNLGMDDSVAAVDNESGRFGDDFGGGSEFDWV